MKSSEMKNIILDTLWPIRCAVCDTPGKPICTHCERRFPFIDQTLACPRCGCPYGKNQCCECSFTMLNELRRTSLPYSKCISVAQMDKTSGAVISAYKDQGDFSFAKFMALYMAYAIPPSRLKRIAGIVYIPDSSSSYRKRGFDHSQYLAFCLGSHIQKDVLELFEKPQSIDQRHLGRRERFSNMKEVIKLKPKAFYQNLENRNVLLIDDVYTTGATLFAASDALNELNVKSILALTFLRG